MDRRGDLSIEEIERIMLSGRQFRYTHLRDRLDDPSRWEEVGKLIEKHHAAGRLTKIKLKDHIEWKATPRVGRRED